MCLCLQSFGHHPTSADWTVPPPWAEPTGPSRSPSVGATPNSTTASLCSSTHLTSMSELLPTCSSSRSVVSHPENWVVVAVKFYRIEVNASFCSLPFRSRGPSTRTAWWLPVWIARPSPRRAATTWIAWIRRLPLPPPTPPSQTWAGTPPLQRTDQTRRRFSSSMSRTCHTWPTTTNWRTAFDPPHPLLPSDTLFAHMHYDAQMCAEEGRCVCVWVHVSVCLFVCVSGDADTCLGTADGA